MGQMATNQKPRNFKNPLFHESGFVGKSGLNSEEHVIGARGAAKFQEQVQCQCDGVCFACFAMRKG